MALYKRGKIYHFSVSRPDGLHRESTKLTSKKEALEFAEGRIAQIKLADQRGYDADKTISDAALAYLAAGKDSRFVGNIVDAWGKRELRTLKPEWVRKHAKDIYPKAGPATLNRQVITPLQAIINFAYQDEDGRQIKIKRFAVDPKKKEAVDAAWHERFAAHALSPGMAAMARFMFETAARISEACRVMPDDIDLDARTVQLTKTKTKPRLTRVSPIMIDMLRSLLAEQPKANRQDKRQVNGVFGYSSRHAVYNGWKTTCDRAGISYAPPHSSGRVSFATELVVRRGIDPVTAAKLGGWASPKVMMDTYAKADGSHEIIDSVFGEQVAQQNGGVEIVTQKQPQTTFTNTRSELDNNINDLEGKNLRVRP